uniref:HIG1 domain-containing protein n=1 Tax=Meloidogyne javanica TaxID=6303 RepID=A0A915N4N7_MELJA
MPVCGTASTAGFIYGLRVAWIHSRLKPGELPRTNLLSGAGLAMQAFGLASLITISVYSRNPLKCQAVKMTL